MKECWKITRLKTVEVEAGVLLCTLLMVSVSLFFFVCFGWALNSPTGICFFHYFQVPKRALSEGYGISETGN